MARPIAGATLLVAGLGLAVLVGGAAGAASPVAAVPDPACGGGGGGALFVADSGFTVEYNDTEPMPADGPVRGDDTLRFRNVTLSSSDDTFLRLEDGTGPETCLAAVDATAGPIEVAPDGEQAAVLEGTLQTLSLADADYGDGTVDLAYESNGPWSITLRSTGLDEGTAVEAVDGSGSELATASVDAAGDLALQLPAGTHEVDLRRADDGSAGGTARVSVTSATADASEVGVQEAVSVTVDLRNDGDASGSYTATLTADGQQVDDATVTVPANGGATVTLSTTFAQSGTYSLAVDGEDAGEVTVADSQAGGETGDGSTAGDGGSADGDGGATGDPLWLLAVLAVVAAGVGGYALARRRSTRADPDAREPAGADPATESPASDRPGTGDPGETVEEDPDGEEGSGDGSAAESGAADPEDVPGQPGADVDGENQGAPAPATDGADGAGPGEPDADHGATEESDGTGAAPDDGGARAEDAADPDPAADGSEGAADESDGDADDSDPDAAGSDGADDGSDGDADDPDADRSRGDDTGES